MVVSDEDSKRPAQWTHEKAHFFKYASRGAGKAVLSNHTLRWSAPSQYNDPFDAQFDLHVDVDHQAARQAFLDRLWDAFYSDQPNVVGNEFGQLIAAIKQAFPRLSREEFNDEFGKAFEESLARGTKAVREEHPRIQEILGRSKILCLSEVEDNILMWSHYAENHKGLVVKLRCVPELDSVWGMAQPVKYAAQMPRLLTNDFLVELLTGQAAIDAANIVEKSIYTKAIDWAYEKEWRIAAGRGESDAPYEDWPFNPQELQAVYLGCRMPDEDRQEFIALIGKAYPHTTILQAQKAPLEFRLLFDPV